MTKKEVKFRIDKLTEELQKLQKVYESMPQGMPQKSINKRFGKLTIQELSMLLTLNETAYNYLQENNTKTIEDYNKTVAKSMQVPIDED